MKKKKISASFGDISTVSWVNKQIIITIIKSYCADASADTFFNKRNETNIFYLSLLNNSFLFYFNIAYIHSNVCSSRTKIICSECFTEIYIIELVLLWNNSK